MVQVNVRRNDSGNVEQFTVTGHAAFGNSGNDIVCAGISTLATNGVNSPEILLGVEINADVKDGYLNCVVPVTGDSRTDEMVQLLVESMIVGMKQMADMYPHNIKIHDSSIGRWKR